MSSRFRPLSVFLLAIIVVATGCGGGTQGGGTETAGTGATISIVNLEFAPQTLTVKVGDTITVDNKDAAEHTVTATDKSFDTGRFAKGTKTFTVTKAGRYEYFCEVHPFMTHRFIQVG